MNKKILLSLLIIGIIASVASAGTWAYFSDVESTASNTITAGTLKIGTVTSATVIFPGTTTIKPGDTITKQQRVTNGGNVAGDLYIKINPTTTDLLDHVTLTVTGSAGGTTGTPVTLTTDTYQKVGSMRGTTESNTGELYLDFDCEMLPAEYNCQGLGTNFKVDFLLIQQDVLNPTQAQLTALAAQGEAP